MNKQPRLHYLDAVRAFALLLGVWFHASLAYIPVFIGWAVMDIHTSNAAAVFALLSHAFRMELFFLLAGFFSAMSIKKYGVQGFIKTRLLKLGVPLLVGWIILRPLLVSGWVMGAQAMRGEIDLHTAFSQGWAVSEGFPEGFLTGTHLWFLYYLLVYCFGLVLLTTLAGLGPELRQAVVRRLEPVVCWFCRSRLAPLAFALVMAPCLWFMSRWGVDTPDKSLALHLPVTLVYGIFFAFGYCLYRDTSRLNAFSRLSWYRLVLLLLAALLMLILAPFETQTGHQYYIWIKAGFSAAYVVFMWLMVAASIGLFRALITSAGRVTTYLSQASYWIYLSHLPLVIWLQVLVSEWPVPWLVKWLLVSTLTLMLTLLSFQLFVRHTFIGRLLTGQRLNTSVNNMG